MFCGLNAKKNHCHITNTEHLVAKIRSVKFSFLLSMYNPCQETLYLPVRGASLEGVTIEKHTL